MGKKKDRIKALEAQVAALSNRSTECPGQHVEASRTRHLAPGERAPRPGKAAFWLDSDDLLTTWV